MNKYIRHIKRGTTYKVIGEGFVQTDIALHDYDRVVVYQSLDAPYDEELVIRRASEMVDGRFEEIEHNHSILPILIGLLLIGLIALGFITF